MIIRQTTHLGKVFYHTGEGWTPDINEALRYSPDAAEKKLRYLTAHNYTESVFEGI